MNKWENQKEREMGNDKKSGMQFWLVKSREHLADKVHLSKEVKEVSHTEIWG